MAQQVEVMERAIVLDAPARAGAVDRLRIWGEAMEQWLESRRSDNTRRAYRAAWESLLAYSSKQPWEIGKADVGLWVTAMYGAGLSECTVAQRIAAVSSFYQYAQDEYTVVGADGREVSLHGYNPAAGRSIRPKISPYGKAIYLSPQEVRALLGAIDRSTVQGLRDYALFLGYIVTGRRNSEVRTLRWGAFVQSGGKTYYRWSGKGKKDQKFEAPEVWYKAVIAWLRAAERLAGMTPEAPIFTALSANARRFRNVADTFEPAAQPLSMREVGRLLKVYARRAGLNTEKLHVHTLRHSAAMLRKEVGVGVEEISGMLGHSSIAVTQIYLHTVEGRGDQSWVKVEALLGLG